MSFIVIQSKVLNEKIILVTGKSIKSENMIRIKYPKTVKYYPEEIDALWDNNISRLTLKEIHGIKKNMKGHIISAENLSKWKSQRTRRDEEEIF